MQANQLLLLTLLFANRTNYISCSEASSTAAADGSGSCATDSDSVKMTYASGDSDTTVPPYIVPPQAILDAQLLAFAHIHPKSLFDQDRLCLKPHTHDGRDYYFVRNYALQSIKARTYRDTPFGRFAFGVLVHAIRVARHQTYGNEYSGYRSEADQCAAEIERKDAFLWQRNNHKIFDTANPNTSMRDLSYAFSDYFAEDGINKLCMMGPDLASKVRTEYLRDDAFNAFKITDKLFADRDGK